MQATAQKKKNGKVLDFIERVGNRLPHPVYLIFMVMSDPGTDQSGMQHGWRQCGKPDKRRNGSCQESHQQGWSDLAVGKSAFQLPGLLTPWPGTGHADCHRLFRKGRSSDNGNAPRNPRCSAVGTDRYRIIPWYQRKYCF